uniref:ATP synthase subunit b, chloroplastic n=1 Tax=Nephroselmis astigmatica TaxID=259378 RepID=A0A088CJ95_9CHLO|nr:CF0 subunit I of ATP synthase [Nephroselmis astigmatica]AID67661.1 CF0 subunit I of ATP synthase [Nephroselmis astigmatica]
MWTILASNLLGEGFGLNLNVLDTNIVNLAVVLGILISVGGDTLTSLLKNRKQTIVKSLQDAEERYQEAQRKLEEAKNQFEAAKVKAEEIRARGEATAKSSADQLRANTEGDLVRLEEAKDATLLLEEEKAVRQVCQRVVSSALKEARKKLAKKLDTSSQKRLFDRSVVLLGKLARSQA